MNGKGVCRTAPAILGLLKTGCKSGRKKVFKSKREKYDGNKDRSFYIYLDE